MPLGSKGLGYYYCDPKAKTLNTKPETLVWLDRTAQVGTFQALRASESVLLGVWGLRVWGLA